MEQIFDIDSNTAATILITIIVFAIGQLCIGAGRLYRRERESRILRKVFIEATEDLCDSIKMESKHLKELSDGLSVSSGVQIKRHHYPSLRFFEELSHLEGTKIFLIRVFALIIGKRSVKRKALRKIWAIVETIRFIHSKHFETTSMFIEKKSRENASRNESMEVLRKEMVDFIIPMDITGPVTDEKEIARALGFIWGKWQDMNDREPGAVHEYLILPCLKVCSQFREHQKARYFMSVLIPIRTSYEAMSYYTDKHKEQILIFSQDLSNCLRVLKKCKEVLSRNC